MEPTQQDKSLSLLAHLLGLLGFIGPLIVFLVVDAEKLPFAKKQAKEALNFQLFLVLIYIGSLLLMFVGIGFATFPIATIFNIVFVIIAAVSTSKGTDYRYPVTIRFIK